MTRVVLSGLVKRFAAGDRPALDGVSLEIPSGTITTVVGPSGCGKSTLLKIVAGLAERRNRTVLRMGYDSAAVLATYLAGLTVLYFLREGGGG